MKLFYKPDNGYLGDVIPFYDEYSKQFKLFFLLDLLKDYEPRKKNYPWYLLSTDDFLHFTNHGVVIPAGDKKDRDYGIWTGSVIKTRDVYHAFYTGGNIYFREQGKPEQAICHAVSRDLLNWKKIPGHTFFAPEDIYEKHDFRDPFIFWNQMERKYWMLVTSRIIKGPPRRRGCFALCKSEDLNNWEISNPFWAPHLYYILECPDLFRIGDWWYLLFSENNEVSTHYRMSKSLNGPWKSAPNDTFDATSFYAAKTASDGKKRYLFGWVSRKAGKNDYNNWEWGGNLLVHEIFQDSDGTLSVKVPDTLDNFFKGKTEYNFKQVTGNWKIDANQIYTDATEGFVYAVSDEIMPSCCKISVNIRFEENVRDLGIMLRVSDDYENAYYLRIEPKKNRMVFDMSPRKNIYPRNTLNAMSDSSFIPGHERYIKLKSKKIYSLKIFVEDDVLVAYLDNKVALSSRIYNIKKGRLGLFVNEGSALFDTIKINI